MIFFKFLPLLVLLSAVEGKKTTTPDPTDEDDSTTEDPSSTAIRDLSCTWTLKNGKTGFSNRAVMCENEEADEVCDALYRKSKVVLNSTEERPETCFENGDMEGDLVKQTAIKTCPRTCGYCCLSAKYNCENAAFPRYRCDKVTPSMCKDPKWERILKEDCPNVCGTCEAHDQKCVDLAPKCANDPTICRQVDMVDFVKVNCQKTCGYCDETTKKPESCGDNTESCPIWKKRGFCTSNHYSLKDKKRFCGVTCGLCSKKP